MLKATIFTWTLAVIIFTFMITVVVVNVYSLMINSDIHTSVNYAKAAEFANLVKYKLEDSDSLVGYSKMLDIAANGLGLLGLAHKTGMVKDLLIDGEMRIKGEPGDESHIVYFALRRDSYPVEDETTLLMRNLGTYIVRAYKINNVNMIIDVYPFPPKCAQGASGGSNALTCAEVLVLAGRGIKEIKDMSDISETIENGGDSLIRLNYHDVVPADFIALKNRNLRAGDQFKFSDDPNCGLQKQTIPVFPSGTSQKIIPVMCFRMVGDYVSPATLQTEISDSDTFYGD